jgi:5-methylcytosine-specific restriction endonuclease McrA
MATVAEAIAAVEAEQQLRAARAEQSDKYQRFYRSRAWRAARYRWLKTQPKPLRCQCCGATSREVRLAVDHIVAIKTDWSRRLDPTNFQILCATDCNLAKGSDQTDWRADEGKIADAAKSFPQGYFRKEGRHIR